MEISLKHITRAATQRAKTADPNAQRCLIENCTSKRAVQLAHVFERDASADDRQTGSLEWGWNMQKDTLNLDTRRNIFFLGASMDQLYKEKRWALLPQEETIHRYFEEDCMLVLPREEFPDMREETFQYTFLPIEDMEDVCLMRQVDFPTGERKVDIHYHPYGQFPTIVSHVHPKFAILQLGTIIERHLSEEHRRALKAKYPILQVIFVLYNEWIAFLPTNAKEDATFMPSIPADEQYDNSSFSELSSEGESTCTPQRRIRLRHVPNEQQSTLSSITSYSSKLPPHCSPIVPPRRQLRPRILKNENNNGSSADPDLFQQSRRRTLLTSRALRKQERDDTDTNKWTPRKIQNWVHTCDPPSPPVLPAKKPGRPRRKKR